MDVEGWAAIAAWTGFAATLVGALYTRLQAKSAREALAEAKEANRIALLDVETATASRDQESKPLYDINVRCADLDAIKVTVTVARCERRIYVASSFFPMHLVAVNDEDGPEMWVKGDICDGLPVCPYTL